MRAERAAISALSVAAALIVSTTAEAGSDDDPRDGTHGEASAAVGLSPTWLQRVDYGDRNRGLLVPELVGFAYLDTSSDRFFVRPGARLGYAGLRRPEMPENVDFVERDAMLAAELGGLYDGPVVPAVALGGGVTARRLALKLAPDLVADEEPISRWEFLPVAYAQLAAGVPVARGALMLEPFARFEIVAGDDRARWRYGIDLTVALR